MTADVEFRIRGYESIGTRLANGHAHITTQPMRRPDLWFAGEPGPFVLWMLSRTAVLNRNIRIGGRRPWLALTAMKWYETA